VLDHIHFGGIVPYLAPRVVDETVASIRNTVARLF
jgi:hypothetical protein